MAPQRNSYNPLLSASFFLIILCCCNPIHSSASTPRMLSLFQQPPLLLNYHRGPLLKGNITVNILWYGTFSPAQRSIISDFFLSLNHAATPAPSVATWWRATGNYRGGPCNVMLGRQTVDSKYELGKVLSGKQILHLARKFETRSDTINFVITAPNDPIGPSLIGQIFGLGWS